MLIPIQNSRKPAKPLRTNVIVKPCLLYNTTYTKSKKEHTTFETTKEEEQTKQTCLVPLQFQILLYSLSLPLHITSPKNALSFLLPQNLSQPLLILLHTPLRF